LDQPAKHRPKGKKLISVTGQADFFVAIRYNPSISATAIQGFALSSLYRTSGDPT
jgi:hypothetical protein